MQQNVIEVYLFNFTAMPKLSARDLARINNFGHHKKPRTKQHANKENQGVPISAQLAYSKP
jgi:hypothetical protein